MSLPFFLLASAAAQLDPSQHSSYGGGVCHSESWSFSLTYINPGSRTCVSVHAHMWPPGLQIVLCVLGFCVCNLLPVNVMLLYMLDSCSFSRTSCVEAAFSRWSSSMISGWLASLQPFCLSSATSLRIMSERIDGWMDEIIMMRCEKLQDANFNLWTESLNAIRKVILSV